MPPTVLSKPVMEPGDKSKRPRVVVAAAALTLPARPKPKNATMPPPPVVPKPRDKSKRPRVVKAAAAPGLTAVPENEAMPPPVVLKQEKEPEKEVLADPARGWDDATERVFAESIAAVRRKFPDWSDVPVPHAALHAYLESTLIIRDAWPLSPRAALHALGFSLRAVRRILNYGADGGLSEDDVKGAEEAVQTRRLVSLLADCSKKDFPAALRWVWEARARIWEWTGGLEVVEKGRKRRKKRKRVGGKMGDGKEEEEETGEANKEGEEEKKEGVEKKTRVKRRMRPKLMPRHCTPDNIKIAIILARREFAKRTKDQEEEDRLEEERQEEEQRERMSDARYLKMQEALGDLDDSGDDDPEGDDNSLIAEILAGDADRKMGRDSPTKQRQMPEDEAGVSVGGEEVKDRKDSKTQTEGSSPDATKPPSRDEPTAQEDGDATMDAIMAAAQDLGDPSLTEDGPSSLTFDTTRFTDQVLASVGLTRRDPPLCLDRRSKRFLPTAAQDLLHTPDKLHHHFYHEHSNQQLLVEISANYARREKVWQEYLTDCQRAQTTPLSKGTWAQREGVTLQQAMFGDLVSGKLRPDCRWDDVRNCMQAVAESWQGVWESHLRMAWGQFAAARADEVFERTDRA
ncbi:uncharacterized protein J3D65DRAFT_670550 [Phyllosticta citribraziliensis]|uniref:Uncharacterized protein n=1 Tax=Phyllosticta citribraziliensis TaxID=989973 RepID=A0ABR1LDP8_9PEZI